MDLITRVITPITARRHEEDFIDRINFQYTPFLFLLSGALITTYTYMQKPITCWTPMEFAGGWIEYATSYCLIENTYYVPMDDPNMPDHYSREETKLQYYQWVNFVLVLLALGFFLPHVLWRSLNWWSGLQVRAIVKACSEIKDDDKRAASIKAITNHIKNTLYQNRHIAVLSRFEKNYTSNFWVTLVYFAMKAGSLLNILFQLVILHKFLGFDWADFFNLRFGFESDWQDTGLFPRSTMCDFDIRNKGNVQRYSVQCVLNQNMFNEKIFLILFYWLVVLFTITVANTFLWAFQLMRMNRIDYMRRMLKSAGVDEPLGPSFQDGDSKKRDHFETFINVTPDASLLFHLISSNAGDSVCCEVIKTLYEIKKFDD
ncbi:unnamed protein product [Auanema sp. JU1783]|nr:unnamed protein product [Auanema sp. JU1783]